MKGSHVVQKAVVGIISFYFVANVQAWVLAQDIGIEPWYQYLATMAISLVFAVIGGQLLNLQKQAFYFFLWYGAFFVTCFLSLLFVKNDIEAVDEFVNYGWFAGLSCAFLLIASRSYLATAAGYGAIAATLFTVGISVVEFTDMSFSLMKQQMLNVSVPQEELVRRAAALHIDPNRSGHALVMGMFVGQMFLPRKFRFWFALVVGVGVFTTVGRSSMSAWALAVTFSVLSGYYTRGKLLLQGVMLGGIFAAGLVLVSGKLPSMLESYGMVGSMSDNIADRLSGNFFTQEDGSVEVRKLLAVEGWKLYSEKPLLGHGLGSTSDIIDEKLGGLHNTILKVAAELGTVGVVVYLSLFLVAMACGSLYGVLLCVVYFFMSLFSHNHLAEASNSILLPLGVAMSMSATQNRRGRRRRRSSLQPT